VQCNNCEQHCTTGAITLIERDPGKSDSLKIPVINKELCTGCGACEISMPIPSVQRNLCRGKCKTSFGLKQS